MAQQTANMLDGLQAAVITEAQKKNEDKQEYKFDALKMYFREDYYVGNIRVVQPTIGNILTMGESNFYSGLSPLLYNSTSIRVMLWDSKIDWCNVKDIEVFNILSTFSTEYTSMGLLFPDNDLHNFKLCNTNDPDTGEKVLCLYNEEEEEIIYENQYNEIAEYVRTLLNIHPKVEKAKGKTAKRWMIDEDRMNAAQRTNNNNSSTLLPLISACVNHPGFKYKLQELRDVGIYEFMDSVKRLQIYESSTALLNGSYSGFCDVSHIDREQFNFMREIHD